MMSVELKLFSVIRLRNMVGTFFKVSKYDSFLCGACAGEMT